MSYSRSGALMEGFTIFLSIILLTFGVLQIILFFKLWGMTNDARAILGEIRIISGSARQELVDELKEAEAAVLRLRSEGGSENKVPAPGYYGVSDLEHYEAEVKRLQAKIEVIDRLKS